MYRIRSLAIVKGGFSFFSSLTSVPKEKLLFDDKWSQLHVHWTRFWLRTTIRFYQQQNSHGPLFSRLPVAVHDEMRLVYIPKWGEGGRLPYERCGDARRLAYGCKFRVLVSLRVFIAKHEEIWKKKFFFYSFYLLDSCNRRLKRSLLGVKNRLRHARIGLLYWFNSKFPTSIPAPFIWESPPPPPSCIPFGWSCCMASKTLRALLLPCKRKGFSFLYGVAGAISTCFHEELAVILIISQGSSTYVLFKKRSNLIFECV